MNGRVDVDIGAIAKMSMAARLEAWKAKKKAQLGSSGKRLSAGSSSSSGSGKELCERAEAHKTFESATVSKSGGVVEDEQNRDPNKSARRRSSDKSGNSSALEALGSNSNNSELQTVRKRPSSMEGVDRDKETKETKEAKDKDDTSKTRRRRSSEGGVRKKKLSGGSRSSFEIRNKGTATKTGASPITKQSPNSGALEAAQVEIARLTEALRASEERADAAAERSSKLEEQMKATWSEIQSQFFLNGVHEQEISALHGELSNTQLDKSEEVREAKRKFKAEKKALQSENAQLRAMGTELADQMENLQQMFLTRQAGLEEELEQKQSEANQMSKQISAMKLREVESKMRVAVAERQVGEMLGQGQGRGRRASNCSSTGSSSEGEEGDGYDTE